MGPSTAGFHHSLLSKCWFSSFYYSVSNFWDGDLTKQPRLALNSWLLDSQMLVLQVWLPHPLPNSLFSNIFVYVWYKLYYTRISWYIALFYSNMFATLPKLLWKMDGKVGSVSEGACRQAWQPKFSPQDLHGRRTEWILAGCSLTSTCVPWYSCTYTHAYTHIVNKCNY